MRLPRICVITFPFRPGVDSYTALSNLLHILEPLSEAIQVVTGNFPEAALTPKARVQNVEWQDDARSTLGRIVTNFATQVRFSCQLARNVRAVDIVIFFGASTFLLPMLTARTMRAKVVDMVSASQSEIAEQVYGRGSQGTRTIMGTAASVLERLHHRLCNRLVVYSPQSVSWFGLERFRPKISIAGEHFIDFRSFRVERPLQERRRLVGYIGRFSEEKGTLHFMQAIARVLEAGAETTFLIGGDGELRPGVEQYAARLRDSIRYVGWISRENLPDYLNELKLLVLPSYTEGLPNIMLEAMACGTPVLATPVGSIPDVLKDGETGFIMENNSPECIAENIVRALNHPDLEQIAGNARMLVESEFTYEAAVERYREVIDETLGR